MVLSISVDMRLRSAAAARFGDELSRTGRLLQGQDNIKLGAGSIRELNLLSGSIPADPWQA
ncbi:hypothetical protein [Rahnella perminowiae]|uniref:hypothetical protein n=1 Tax=Rahnella perminowiae TaxID=2816244 RepID=UPI00215BC6BF|nr:hypothetical protein [Rahnella perminowiae]MCR9003096.1 hypothetical protein [Rahnella perminowiae]